MTDLKMTDSVIRSATWEHPQLSYSVTEATETEKLIAAYHKTVKEKQNRVCRPCATQC